VPVSELHAAKSGERFISFLVAAEALGRSSPGQDKFPLGQLSFPAREALCERFRTGKSPTWDQHRRESSERGLPTPYYGPDVVDPGRRAELVADRAAFLRRHAADDSFDVAASFMGADVGPAVGFVPRREDAARDILRSMCVRCHAANVDHRLGRARFNAEAIDQIGPVTATAVRRRLSLPRSSPELMPPLRVGELPSWAIALVERYRREHCTDPGACG
jgi:hypothetical protein